MQETWVWSLGWKDPLEKEMVTHSSFLAWEIPWTEEPSGLQKSGIHKSPQGHKRVGHNLVTKQQQQQMVALQCCTTKPISYMYTRIPSLLALSPTCPPSHPSKSPLNTELSSLRCAAVLFFWNPVFPLISGGSFQNMNLLAPFSWRFSQASFVCVFLGRLHVPSIMPRHNNCWINIWGKVRWMELNEV